MSTTEKAGELEGNVDKDSLVDVENSDDIEERAWMKAALMNPAFDFLNDPEEDIYGPGDGKPFRDP